MTRTEARRAEQHRIEVCAMFPIQMRGIITGESKGQFYIEGRCYAKGITRRRWVAARHLRFIDAS